MKVVIACDSFKGCLTSREAGEAAAEGVRLAIPGAETIVVPVADGGEGTVEAIADALGGRIVNVSVDGPLGAPTEAYYAISRETAVIEVAAACGLTLVDESGRNPMIATTYGVGQLIRDAILSGCRRFLIGLGGSATNDAGVGMLRALGWRFFDSDGLEIGRYAGEVGRISRIDTSMVMPELAECQFTVACDVKNPLVGPLGASHVFGPQKGASPAMADALDQALASFARLASDMYGKDLSSVPGAGAAGGLGF
ncbi:MAG: glycerate kinase, partial [Muribaculaceae bacterium]|nr:glycerate kinase [Muribaculaceae bacterium]